MAIDPSALLAAPNAAGVAALLPASNAGGLGGLGGLNTDQAHAYLSNAYNSLLNRAPDQSAISAFDANANQSPTDIVQSIIESPEYRTNQIRSMYQNYLGRDADQAGLDNYYNSDMGLNDIQNTLQNSSEGQAYAAQQAASPVGPSLPQGPGLDRNTIYQTLPWSQNGNSIDQLTSFYNQAFSTLGASDPQLATQALLGSAAREDPGFNPTQTQSNSSSPSAGQGIWQLTGDRYNGAPNPAHNVLNYQQFAQQNGYDPASLETQARFGIYDMIADPTYSGLGGNKNAALQQLLKAKDINQAMNGALAFEQPGVPATSQRIANAIALKTYQNGGGITAPQLNTILGGANNGIPNNALPPGVMPNNISLSNPNQPYSMPIDTRTDQANAGIDQSVSANNTLLNGWNSNAANNLLNFNANSVFNPGGMISSPFFGSSALGQPNMFGGTGTNNIPPSLLIQGPGSFDGP